MDTGNRLPMNLQHVNVKVFVEGAMPVPPERFINVFHQWIQEQTLPELLIDVADYGHVPGGPGILLVAHEADYSMDNTDHRWGLRYNRKAALEGSNHDRFRQAFAAAANACGLLEKHFASDGLRFSSKEFELFFNDRALVPNTAETLAFCKPEVLSFLARALGHDKFQLDCRKDPRQRFGFHITSATPFDLALLAGK